MPNPFIHPKNPIATPGLTKRKQVPVSELIFPDQYQGTQKTPSEAQLIENARAAQFGRAPRVRD